MDEMCRDFRMPGFLKNPSRLVQSVEDIKVDGAQVMSTDR